MRKILIFSLLVVLFAIPARGQTDREKFELYNKCRPIGLVVEGMSEDAKKIDLTREIVINFVESRLLSARIYGGNSYEYLYVRIGILGNSVDIDTSFKKATVSYGEVGLATTWVAGKFGSHGSDAMSKDYILSGLSELIDKFIASYLKVNQKYCR